MASKKEIQTKTESEEYRECVFAAAGFALVLVIVGLPVWWTTTTVYRASLPYSAINELASRKIYQTIHLSIVAEEPYKLKDDLNSILNTREDFIRFVISSREFTIAEKNALKAAPDLSSVETSLPGLHYNITGTLTIFFLSSPSKINSSQIYIGRNRLVIAATSSDIHHVSTVVKSMVLDPVASQLHLRYTSRLLDSKEKNHRTVMRQVPTEPGYDITLTLMLPEPHLLKANWDAHAIDDYLEPLVDQLRSVARLRIRSQILYITGLKVTPKWSPKHGHFALPEQQLPLTINDIEAKLGSFVSTRPSLHFIIYVPMEHQVPLVIHTKDDIPSESNSFLVPRWGSVLIHNPPSSGDRSDRNDSHLMPQFKEFPIDSHRVMRTIITHLHKLFPIPVLKEEPNVIVAKRDDIRLSGWQVDAFSRARIFMYLNNIKITLQSLRDLVGEISNMVVSDEVAGWVWTAVQSWEDCMEAGREGRLKEATLDCTHAFSNSDAAFFHPSMLALLYFPDNQKYAIYVPLFLPVSIPVLLSFKMIFKYVASRRKPKME